MNAGKSGHFSIRDQSVFRPQREILRCFQTSMSGLLYGFVCSSNAMLAVVKMWAKDGKMLSHTCAVMELGKRDLDPLLLAVVHLRHLEDLDLALDENASLLDVDFVSVEYGGGFDTVLRAVLM